MDIQSILEAIKQQHTIDSLDWENPTCAECKRHFAAKNIYDGLCAECSDDKLQADTGCRFGKPQLCNVTLHPDCF